MSEYGPTGHWFEHEEEKLPMFYHMYNLTHLNERCVELAIAKRFLIGRDPKEGIEVGNVMGHYWDLGHQIVDLHEPPAWYQNPSRYHSVDVFDLNGVSVLRGWAISLSTVEHTENPADAIDVIHRLAPFGLITFPTGVDPTLDSWLEDGAPGSYSVSTVCRVQNDHGGWETTPLPQVRPYGPWANCIAVLKWCNE